MTAPRIRTRAPLPGTALALATAALAAAATPAAAQVREVESIVVEQSRIIERFSPPPVKGSASLDVAALRDAIPAELAAQRRFTLRRVRVEGATALAPERLRPLWADMVGRTATAADLFDLATRIERRYRADGLFAVATVPVQDLADGDIRVVVFDQSFIRTVETRGDAARLRERIAPYIDRLVAMQPLREDAVERVLLLMSDVAGLTIEGTLRRPDTPGNGGAFTLEITAARRVTRLALNNHGSDEVGPFQAVAIHQENDLFGRFESTTLTAATVPDRPRELLFAQVAQDAPLGHDGLHVGARVGAARSRPGGELEALDVAARSYTGEVYALYPVLRTVDDSVWVRGALVAWGADVDILGQPAARDRYRWLALEVESEHDTALGAVALSAGLLQGIDAFGATGAGDPLAGRPGADPGFRLAAATAELAAPLAERVTLIARAAGQHGFGPLPAEVRMAFGGESYGRAFDDAVLSGDSAVMAGLEVAVDADPPLPAVRRAAVYGFVDHGALWMRGDGRDGGAATLGSAGLGLRAVIGPGIAVDAAVATPTTLDDAVEDPGTRLFVSLKMQL